jgi:hypothetical protein
MKALIAPNEKIYNYAGTLIGERVAEVCEISFDVSEPLFWVDCSDQVNAAQWYYDPSNGSILPIPETPYAIASFVPNPVFVGQATSLTWEAFYGTAVMLGSYGQEQFPTSGSKVYNYPNAGTYSEVITVVAPAGNVSRTITVKVVATQAETISSGNAPITVI